MFEMRERVEGKEQLVRQLDQERRDAADAASAEDAARKTKTAELRKEKKRGGIGSDKISN